MGTSGDTKVRFIGTVSTAGRDKVVIVVPKENHKDVKNLKGKKLWVTLDEILPPKD